MAIEYTVAAYDCRTYDCRTYGVITIIIIIIIGLQMEWFLTEPNPKLYYL
jgi:hypothetical protein